jgi:large subunit ribosomal protein L13
VDTLSYKTISANKETATKEWVVVDATDQVVGRLGAKVAKLLRGKYKPNFTPHVDCGDNVIIINADKVKFTGNKWNDKIYLSYTGYPGGQREITPARLMAKPNGAEKLMKSEDMNRTYVYQDTTTYLSSEYSVPEYESTACHNQPHVQIHR